MRMAGLFRNEIFKLYRSKAVRIALACFLLFEIIFCFDEYRRHPPLYQMLEYGYGSVIWYYNQVAPLLQILSAVVAAEMTTKEIQRRTIHNVLGRGIRRWDYWLVKLVCFLGFNFLLDLIGALGYMAGRTLIVGFNPFHVTYPDYLLVNLVFVTASTIVYFVPALLIFCIGFMSRSTAVTSLSGTVLVTLDNFACLNLLPEDAFTPMRAVLIIREKFFLTERILTADFARYLFPFLCMDLFLILLSWILFRRKDV